MPMGWGKVRRGSLRPKKFLNVGSLLGISRGVVLHNGVLFSRAVNNFVACIKKTPTCILNPPIVGKELLFTWKNGTR